MFLASTVDVIRVVTGSAVSTIGVQASWVDNGAGVYTPGRTNTAITTAATSTVVASPAASTVRSLRTLVITNNHATSSNAITLQHFDGTTSIDIKKITLLAGERIAFVEDGSWQRLTRAGGEYEYTQPGRPTLGITGTIAETLPREFCIEGNLTITGGSLLLTGVYLAAGQVVTSISFFSGSTAGATLVNQLFCLYDARYCLVAQSANDGATAWAANAIKTLAMTSAYTVPTAGLYYIGLLVTGTTIPTFKGNSGGTTLVYRAPSNQGVSTTALTTTLPTECAIPAFSGAGQRNWAAIT